MDQFRTTETIIGGVPVKIVSYQLGSCFITEVESSTGDCLITRGIAPTPVESMERALNSLSKRLLHARLLGLTVGG